MKIYIRAYWYDEEESIDDFIYKPSRKSNIDDVGMPEEIITDDPYDDIDYGDFDEYELYDYSEYEAFYRQIKRRKIYVPDRVTRDIPDYNAYRKALFGTLCLSMKSGESIESLYDELSSDFPEIVKKGLMNDSDMLLELVDAALYAQNLLNHK